MIYQLILILELLLGYLFYWLHLLTVYRFGPASNIYIFIYFWLACIFLSLIYVTYPRIMRNIFRQIKLNTELLSLSAQQALKDQQDEQLKKVYDQARKLQNDSRETLLALQNHLIKKEHTLALEAVGSYKQKMKIAVLPFYCSNSFVNAILYNKEQLAREKQIAVGYQVLLPETMSLSPTLLSSLYFNLLDNAINSCMKSDSSEPFIFLETSFRANFLHVHMVNSKEKDTSFSHIAPDNDSLHGYGLTIIEEIAAENDGVCEWQDCGDYFESNILLRF